MKINVEVGDFVGAVETRVGNVYAVRGGRGLRDGHMQVLIAIATRNEAWRGDSALLLVIDKEGNPVGVNSYGLHAVDNMQPIAFVDGLDSLNLTMRSL